MHATLSGSVAKWNHLGTITTWPQSGKPHIIVDWVPEVESATLC